MIATFEAALSSGAHAGTLTIYANYAMQVLEDYPLALRLLREAVVLDPTTAQFRINLIKLTNSMKLPDESRRHIAVLRTLGRLGQYEPVADDLAREVPAPATTR